MDNKVMPPFPIDYCRWLEVFGINLEYLHRGREQPGRLKRLILEICNDHRELGGGRSVTIGQSAKHLGVSAKLLVLWETSEEFLGIVDSEQWVLGHFAQDQRRLISIDAIFWSYHRPHLELLDFRTLLTVAKRLVQVNWQAFKPPQSLGPRLERTFESHAST